MRPSGTLRRSIMRPGERHQGLASLGRRAGNRILSRTHPASAGCLFLIWEIAVCSFFEAFLTQEYDCIYGNAMVK